MAVSEKFKLFLKLSILLQVNLEMAAQNDVNQALIENTAINARQERRGIIIAEANKILKCDGSDPFLVRQWIQEIQMIGEMGPQDKIDVMKTTASGSFRLELETFLQTNQDATWAQIRAHLLASFVSSDHEEHQRGLLMQVKQNPGEGLLAFHRRFRTIANEAYPEPRNGDQQRELVKIYGRSLYKDLDAKKLVSEGWPATLDDAFRRMNNRETGVERYQHLGRAEEPMDVDAIEVGARPVQYDKISKSLDKIMSKISALEASQKVLDKQIKGQRKVAHVDRTPNSAAAKRDRSQFASRNSFQSANRDKDKKCHYCGRMGHIQRNCFTRYRSVSNAHHNRTGPPVNTHPELLSENW